MSSAPKTVIESRSSGFFRTSMEDMPDSDMYVVISPRVDIPSKRRGTMGCTSASNPSLGAYSEPWRPPLKENSSYMILHSANPPLLHVYDEVHNSTTLRPCEYEMPASCTPSCVLHSLHQYHMVKTIHKLLINSFMKKYNEKLGMSSSCNQNSSITGS